MGLISPVRFFSLRYDKVFSLKQTLDPLQSYPSSESESSSSISGNIPQSLKHSRCLEKTSYHSPELQDQGGHGNLRIDHLRRRVRDCLKVLYRGSRYCVVSWLDLGIFDFSEVYLGTFNIRGVVFPEAFEDR